MPSMSAKKAYEELYAAGLNTSNVEALSDLFRACGLVSQPIAATQGHSFGQVTSVV